MRCLRARQRSQDTWPIRWLHKGSREAISVVEKLNGSTLPGAGRNCTAEGRFRSRSTPGLITNCKVETKVSCYHFRWCVRPNRMGEVASSKVLREIASWQ